MNGGISVVKTKTEVQEFITSMSDVDFTMLCEFLNTIREKRLFFDIEGFKKEIILSPKF